MTGERGKDGGEGQRTLGPHGGCPDGPVRYQYKSGKNTVDRDTEALTIAINSYNIAASGLRSMAANRQTAGWG